MQAIFFYPEVVRNLVYDGYGYLVDDFLLRTADFEEGRNAGVTGTPAFVLNGRLLRGLRSPDDLAQRIERALADAGAPQG